jgi:hypothetical protein
MILDDFPSDAQGKIFSNLETLLCNLGISFERQFDKSLRDLSKWWVFLAVWRYNIISVQPGTLDCTKQIVRQT